MITIEGRPTTAAELFRHEQETRAACGLPLLPYPGIRDGVRWNAYKRWLLSSKVGPRFDITTSQSLDAFADALIAEEQAVTQRQAGEVIEP